MFVSSAGCRMNSSRSKVMKRLCSQSVQKVIVHSELVQRATLMICVAALCYTELVVVHRTPSTRDSQRCSACFVWWCTFERGVDFHLHSRQLLQPLREFIHRLCPICPYMLSAVKPSTWLPNPSRSVAFSCVTMGRS